MKPATKSAITGGLAIGLAILIWQIASHYLRLLDDRGDVIQVTQLGWIPITFIGYFLTLRRIRSGSLHWSYFSGLRGGILAAIMVSLVAIAGQIGFFIWIRPEWPQHLADQARMFSEAQGMPEAQIELRVKGIREANSLKNTAIRSALETLFIGGILSAILMIFLRKRPEEREGTGPDSLIADQAADLSNDPSRSK